MEKEKSDRTRVKNLYIKIAIFFLPIILALIPNNPFLPDFLHFYIVKTLRMLSYGKSSSYKVKLVTVVKGD